MYDPGHVLRSYISLVDAYEVDFVDGQFSLMRNDHQIFEHRHQATERVVRTWMGDRDIFLSASFSADILRSYQTKA